MSRAATDTPTAEATQAGRRQPWPRWREVALNVGAAAGVVCILAAAASFLFGITPLVFRSGSMAPAIGTGALAMAKTVPASEIRVGDVISVENDRGTSITHRVVAIEPTTGGGAQVTLKGDANRVSDPLPYSITEAKRVLFHVPGLGYAVAWLSSGTAVFLGGALTGALLMLAFGPNRPTKKTPTLVQAEDIAAEELSEAQENSHV
ncbi:signal peptidase I [Rhodococcus sp. D2-41]|nr:signal peptidase I [Rhodococcus sp. D2-41]